MSHNATFVCPGNVTGIANACAASVKLWPDACPRHVSEILAAVPAGRLWSCANGSASPVRKRFSAGPRYLPCGTYPRQPATAYAPMYLTRIICPN